MSEYLVFTADGDYFALAQDETLRDNYLRQVMITTHREGYAEPLPPTDPQAVQNGIDDFERAYRRGIAR